MKTSGPLMNYLIWGLESLFPQFRFFPHLDLKKKDKEAGNHQRQHPE